MSGDEAVRKEFEAWARTWFDGEGEDPIFYDPAEACYSRHAVHSAWMAWQASRSAAIQECAAIADYEHAKAAGWEEQTDSNAAWYVKVTCERIEAAILALKER